MNKRRKTKIELTILSLCLLLLLTAGGTIAYMFISSNQVANQFTPAEIVVSVDENFDNKVKTNVKITSLPEDDDGSNVDCYIRAAIVVNWMDSQGNVYGKTPVAGIDYDLVLTTDEGQTSTGWIKRDADGYYYFKDPVSPGDSTGILIIRCEPLATNQCPDGYFLNVDILAQAVQAKGVTDVGGYPAVEDAWGLNPGSVGTDSSLDPNHSN